MGVLDTSQPINYEPKIAANKLIFHAKDKAGTSLQVVFNGTKTDVFAHADSLVMTEYVKDKIFHCNSVKIKCL